MSEFLSLGARSCLWGQGQCRSRMLSHEGLAKPPGAVPSAGPPPPGVVVRTVHNGRAKSAIHFSRSGNVPLTCSGDGQAVFQWPLEHRWNVAGKSYCTVARTRIVGLGDTTLLRLFNGGDVGGGCTAASSGRTTPGPYPRSHALTATHELCAGFDSPKSTPKSKPPMNLPGPPAPLQRSGHRWPQYRPRPSTPTRTRRATRTRANSWRIAPRCPCPRMGRGGLIKVS